MGGQFAANEQVTIVGLKLRAIENVGGSWVRSGKPPRWRFPRQMR